MELSHVGIAVRSIEERLRLWRDVFGLRVEAVEDVTEQKVRVAMLSVGELKIELLQPITDDSPVAKFIAKRGEGLHHLSFEVDDIEKKIGELERNNVKMIDRVPRMSFHGTKIAFIHPSSTGGVLIEISQGAADK